MQFPNIQTQYFAWLVIGVNLETEIFCVRVKTGRHRDSAIVRKNFDGWTIQKNLDLQPASDWIQRSRLAAAGKFSVNERIMDRFAAELESNLGACVQFDFSLEVEQLSLEVCEQVLAWLQGLVFPGMDASMQQIDFANGETIEAQAFGQRSERQLAWKTH